MSAPPAILRITRALYSLLFLERGSGSGMVVWRVAGSFVTAKAALAANKTSAVRSAKDKEHCQSARVDKDVGRG